MQLQVRGLNIIRKSTGPKSVASSSVVNSLMIRVGAVIFITTLVIGYLWIDSEYRDLADTNRRFAENYLEEQKQILRNDVLRMREFVHQQQARASTDLRRHLKNHVYQAHSVATGIYRQYNKRLPDFNIQQRIIDSLRYSHFASSRSYYFIDSFKKTPLLYPPDPAVEGHTMDASLHSREKHEVTQKTLELVSTEDEGYILYDWYRPEDNSTLERKYSFVNALNPITGSSAAVTIWKTSSTVTAPVFCRTSPRRPPLKWSRITSL